MVTSNEVHPGRNEISATAEDYMAKTFTELKSLHQQPEEAVPGVDGPGPDVYSASDFSPPVKKDFDTTGSPGPSYRVVTRACIHSAMVLLPSCNASLLVYACFLCLGLGTLLPWNFFITAESYWQYKFRNTTNVTLTEDDLPPQHTELQKLYTPMQVCFSQVTNFTLLIINALFSHRLSVRRRLMTSLVLMLLFFTITTILVKVDSDDWQTAFFIITILLIVLLNSCGAVFQGGLFGLAGMFPARYMTAAVSGQALGGVFASLARIVSLAAGADDITSAFIYFLIAVVVLGITVGALYYLCNTVWPLGLSVTGVFWVTLAVFPAVCVKITSTSDNASWSDTYFQPVMTFLLFNVGDLLGRQAGGFLQRPRPGSRVLYVLVALRLVFIPLLLFCNHTSTSVPVFFHSDVAYFFIMALFALSNGYLGTLCLIYAPRSVTDSKDAERAGSVMAAMLGLGLMLGAATSFGFGMIL
ncbi:Equilibrative nucleoside transporter [Trinorchestia longiramus]|nr:Equilibrative nucleoside transporter [Trinorchestia longiramus]